MLSDLQLIHMVPRNSTQLLNINTTKFQVEREAASQSIRNLTNCSVHIFKNSLDNYLSTLLDDPTLPYNDNSVDARISETRRRLQRMAWRMKNSVKQAQSK